MSLKTALIVGGANGLGRSIAETLAQSCQIIVADIDQTNGQELVKKITQAGGQALFHQIDIRDEHQVIKLMNVIEKKYGQLHFAVNSALEAMDYEVTLSQFSVELFDALWQTNVKGFALCLKHQIQQMSKYNFGRIINMSSVVGPMSNIAGMGLYAATKSAIVTLSKTAALEVASVGITVNAICCNGYNTGCFNRYSQLHQLSDEQRNHAVPVGFVPEPAELGSLVAFLCSDEARFITGAALTVDGGFSI